MGWSINYYNVCDSGPDIFTWCIVSVNCSVDSWWQGQLYYADANRHISGISCLLQIQCTSYKCLFNKVHAPRNSHLKILTNIPCYHMASVSTFANLKHVQHGTAFCIPNFSVNSWLAACWECGRCSTTHRRGPQECKEGSFGKSI